MSDLYLKEVGTGTEDGSTEPNAMAYADSLGADWAGVRDTGGTLYFVGDFTSRVTNKQGGTSSLMLHIDCGTYNATFIGSGADTGAWSTTSYEYVRQTGGTYYAIDNGTQLFAFDLFRPAGTYILEDATIISETLGIRSWCDSTTNNVGITIRNCTITANTTNQATKHDAIQFAHSATGTTIYEDILIEGNTITGGKFVTLYGDFNQMVRIDGRRNERTIIRNNTFINTPANATQLTCTGSNGWSYIQNNIYLGCGHDHGNNNLVQTNWNYNLVIEDNYFDSALTHGSGDGNCIIVDWEPSEGDYSDNVIVRRNLCNNANTSGAEFACGIGLWATKNTHVYDNICIGNNAGITTSEAMSARIYPITSHTVANPTVITYDPADGDDRILKSGDSIVITGAVGGTPSINGTHIITYITNTTVSIPINVTVAGTGGSITETHRSTGNKVYNNVCLNNLNYGIAQKFGSYGQEWYNNIIVGSPIGFYIDNQYGGGGHVEENNVFWDNVVNRLYESTEEQIDSSSLNIDPKLLVNGLPNNLKLTGIGKIIDTYLKDYKGNKFKIPPSIGAYELNVSRGAAKSGRTW